MAEPGYPIRAVAEMTGLTQHAIRAWEKRYGVVDPDRTDTNRRLYSTHDVERLRLFKRASEKGHSLAQLAGLKNDAIRGLLGASPSVSLAADDLAGQAIQAALDMDAQGLEAILDFSLARDGVDGVIDQVVLPLLAAIDKQWVAGTLSIAQEHSASAVLRPFLHRARQSMRAASNAPKMAIATLPGELHELGALLAALVVASRGWRVLYLGPSLPIGEIAAAAKTASVEAVGISVVSPRMQLDDEVLELRGLLGRDKAIVVGGREGRLTSATLSQALCFSDLQELREFLASRA